MGWPLRDLRSANLDFARLLTRYEGRLVSVVTGDSVRLLGTLASVNDDAVRLVHVQITDQVESGGWMDQMLMSSDDDRSGLQWPEVLVSFHMLRTVCCLDDGILDIPLDDEFAKLPSAAPPPTPIEIELPNYDPICIELGIQLVTLADAARGGTLIDRVRRCRAQIARETGWSPPKIRVRDDIQLKPLGFRILVQDVTVLSGELQVGQLLAVSSEGTTGTLSGIHAIEPVYGLPAWWIDPADRDHAELNGYTVVEPAEVLTTALTDTLRRYAGDLLSFNAVEGMLANLEDAHSATVRNLYPSVISLPLLHEILRELLIDGVSVLSFPRIVESLGRLILSGVARESLYAQLRMELGRQICEPFLYGDRQLAVITFDTAIVATLRSMAGDESDLAVRAWWKRLAALLKKLWDDAPASAQQVLLVDPELRRLVRNTLRKLLPRLAVLTLVEIPLDVTVSPSILVTESALESLDDDDELSADAGVGDSSATHPQQPR